MPKSPNPTLPDTSADVRSKPFPFPTMDNHPSNPEQQLPPVVADPSEEAIDNGIEESFPASDPVSVTVTKAVAHSDKEKDENKDAKR